MSIDVQKMYDDKASKFGARSSTRFGNDFIRSFNNVLGDMEMKMTMDTMTRIDSPNGTYDLSATYEGLLSEGIDYYLQKMAEWAVSDIGEVGSAYFDMLRTGQMHEMRNDEDVEVGLGDLS